MSRMIQKLDSDHMALRKEHSDLIQKFNKERELVFKLKQKLNEKFKQLEETK